MLNGRAPGFDDTPPVVVQNEVLAKMRYQPDFRQYVRRNALGPG
jgi:predicted RNA-binding protein with PUA domain